MSAESEGQPRSRVPDVSVVIVSHNVREALRACLASLSRPDGCALEIIVVDNASADGSAGMVAGSFPRVRLIDNVANRGFAAACNQGIRRAGGRYVLLLNPDTVVLAGAIENAVAFADGHPEAGVVGCRVLNADGSLQPSCFQEPRAGTLWIRALGLSRLFAGHPVFGQRLMTFWPHDAPRDVATVKGCFMLLRREVLDAVGLLDEAFFLYGEETDLCCRVRRAGWRVMFTPQAQIVHLGGQSSGGRAAVLGLAAQFAALVFIRKHRPAALWAAQSAVVVHFLLRIPPLIVLAVLGPGRNAFYRDLAFAYARGAAVLALPGRRGRLSMERWIRRALVS